MQRLKMLGLAILAVFALAAVAVATASAALPTVNNLTGETGEITAKGAAEGENIAELSTALSAPITAKKVKISTAFAAGASSGTYVADFEEALFEGLKCNTPSDPDGTILVSGPLDLVVGNPGAPFAGAFLLSETLVIECGPLGKPTVTIKITGGTLGKIEGVTENVDLTSFKGNLKCTKPNNGKQELKEYLNSEGKATKLILSANLGLGAESACEEVKEPVTLSTNKMAFFANI